MNRICYYAFQLKGHSPVIALVTENEPGYRPLQGIALLTLDAARDYTLVENMKLGHDRVAVKAIVQSSVDAQRNIAAKLVWQTTSEENPICCWCQIRLTEKEVPVRVWNQNKTHELAFHPNCYSKAGKYLGFANYGQEVENG